MAAPRNAHDPAHAFDHHASCLIDTGRHQGNPDPALGRQLVDPFGARSRLAEASPGHHQPHPPALAIGHVLTVIGPHLEQGIEQQLFARRHRLDRRALVVRGKRSKQPDLRPRQTQGHRRPRAQTINPIRSNPPLISTALATPERSASRCRTSSSRSRIRSRTSANSSAPCS